MKITNTLDINIHKQIEKLELTEFPRNFVSDYKLTYAWQEKNINTLVYILDGEKLIGHISFLPILKEIYDEILSGNNPDTEFSINNILDENEKNIYLYLCVVFVDKNYRGKGLAFKMYEYYKNLFKNYKINGIVSDVITKSGEKFCKKVGLKFYKKSSYGSKIYIGEKL